MRPTERSVAYINFPDGLPAVTISDLCMLIHQYPRFQVWLPGQPGPVYTMVAGPLVAPNGVWIIQVVAESAGLPHEYITSHMLPNNYALWVEAWTLGIPDDTLKESDETGVLWGWTAAVDSDDGRQVLPFAVLLPH